MAHDDVELPSDVQLLTERLTASLRGHQDSELVDAVLMVRFPVGVKLRGARPGEPGSETGFWLVRTAPTGTGWRAADDWYAAAAAAADAGSGGMSFVRFAEPADCAVVIHNARDGNPWALQVAPEADAAVRISAVPLARLDRGALATPVSVAVVDWCAEVLPGTP